MARPARVRDHRRIKPRPSRRTSRAGRSNDDCADSLNGSVCDAEQGICTCLVEVDAGRDGDLVRRDAAGAALAAASAGCPADDCATLKKRLETMAAEAGLATKSKPQRKRFVVVNRLAIEELEAWYFGDWQAVRQAYPKVNGNVPSQAKYRAPDEIKGGTWEAFERVMRAGGYFRTGLRKIEADRAVAAHMDPSRNTSPSFCALRDALTAMVAA